MDLLQKELDNVKKQEYPNDRPNLIYQLPAAYGKGANSVLETEKVERYCIVMKCKNNCKK